MSRLAEALGEGRFVITAEIAPPASGSPDRLLALAEPLLGLADAVNVTDAAGARASMSALAASALIARVGVEPVLQLTCRDRNRIALQGDVIGASALGIRNIMALGGDSPAAGDQPDAKPVFDIDTRGLLRMVARLRDEGVLPSGRAVEGMGNILLGAAEIPGDPASGWQPEGLAAKVAAGARFIQTQFCMDLDLVERWAGAVRAARLPAPVHLLIGIAPLASARSARWMRENLFGTVIPDSLVARLDAASDPAEEGRRITLDILHALSEMPGVAGAHVMAPANPSAIPAVLRTFRAR
jgi:methylenetetrahydrofolate reductase (NADPH)